MKNALTSTERKQSLSDNDQGMDLCGQLFRYAEDLQTMMDNHSALEADHQRLRALMSQSYDIHMVTDGGGKILQANQAATVLAPRQMLEQTKLQQWVSECSRNRFMGLMSVAYENSSDQPIEGTFSLDRSGGIPLRVSARILTVSAQQQARRLHWVLHDISHMHQSEIEARMTALMLQNVSEGVMITDPDGTIMYVNMVFSRITGYSESESLGQNAKLLNSGQHDAAFYAEFWQSLHDSGSWKGELLNKRKNGEIYEQRLTINAMRDSDDNIIRFIAFLYDKSETEEHLSYLAHHDALTGLPNRLLLQDRLAQMMMRAQRLCESFCLIFIDLDGFKQINDIYGHAIGDGVLREAAKRLSETVRKMDTVARLGGDEFIILAANIGGEKNIGLFCNKLISELCKPICEGQHTLSIGGSLGCAEYPRHGEDDAMLLQIADQAMYQAKAAGGNTYVIYQSDELRNVT